jgi:branched-chain amino acid transport system ATP-binding protein
MSLLEVRRINTYYGGSHVLFEVSMEVPAGEVVCLLGRNGAGKTTTLRSIVGLTPPRTGQIVLDGRDVTGFLPFRVARMGVGYVPEERRIFPHLTVQENLEVGRRTWDAGRAPWTESGVYELFPQLGALRRQRAGHLSGGEQQMLAIARTLMGSPSVLLLDEPSEGLAPLVVRRLKDQLRGLKAAGLTLVLAEQNVRFVQELGDRVYVLENGVVKYQGSMRDFLDNEEIRRAYLAM